VAFSAFQSKKILPFFSISSLLRLAVAAEVSEVVVVVVCCVYKNR
jgi:hypothetical protein